MARVQVPGYVNITEYKEGGSAHILKAVRKADGMPVAIKMIKPEVVTDKEQFKAFKQEAEMMADFRCRSIVRVFEYVTGALPRPAFVMEFFPSENLKVVLWRAPQLCRTYWYPILWESAGALMYCHEQGVIHRDVKPENILVAKNGLAKLCDFSLAVSKKIKPKKIQGTTTYIAPEQIQKKKLDYRTDVYSFGVTAYELMVGKPPFIGTSPQSILEKHVSAMPQSLKQIDAEIDSELAAMIMRMLSKDLGNRPTMKEFLETMRSIRTRVSPPPMPGSGTTIVRTASRELQQPQG